MDGWKEEEDYFNAKEGIPKQCTLYLDNSNVVLLRRLNIFQLFV